MTDESSQSTNGNGATAVPREPAPPAAARAARSPFDLNDQQKRVLILVLIVHVLLTRFTLRDLRHRPETAVRGPKRLWRVWATMNTTGSLAYWTVGRRRGAAGVKAGGPPA